MYVMAYEVPQVHTNQLDDVGDDVVAYVTWIGLDGA